MKEAIRYLNNAKELLQPVKIANDTYMDVKPVREAFGTAYLAVLEAINEYLITKKAYHKKDLPKSVEGYRAALIKHGGVHNGKLKLEFEKLYDILHIWGYYRGTIYDTTMVKDALKAARHFIDRLN